MDVIGGNGFGSLYELWKLDLALEPMACGLPANSDSCADLLLAVQAGIAGCGSLKFLTMERRKTDWLWMC